MPNSYPGNAASFPENITTPVGTDPRTAESVRVPLQQLADRTAALRANAVHSVNGSGLIEATGGTDPVVSLRKSGASTNDVVKFNGTDWVAGPVPGGGGGGGAPTGPAGGILGYPGSTYPSPNGLAPVLTSTGEAVIPIKASGTPIIKIKPDNTSGMFTPGQGVEFAAGDAGGNSGVGGPVRLKGGAAGANAQGGSATVAGGEGSSAYPPTPGGDAFFSGGSGARNVAGHGGNSYAHGGDGSLDAFNSPCGFGGHLFLRGGVGYERAAHGRVDVGDINTSAINVGAANVPTTFNGQTTLTPSATKTISTASDSFSPETTLVAFMVAGGNVTLASTPALPTAGIPPGRQVVLRNIGGANYLELQRGASFGLRLSAATKRIDVGGSITLLFDGEHWVEIAHVETTTL